LVFRRIAGTLLVPFGMLPLPVWWILVKFLPPPWVDAPTVGFEQPARHRADRTFPHAATVDRLRLARVIELWRQIDLVLTTKHIPECRDRDFLTVTGYEKRIAIGANRGDLGHGAEYDKTAFAMQF
jgi:hypothetical protein